MRSSDPVGCWAGARAAILLSSTALAGCIGNPYAARLDNVDEATPQAPAAIQVSDPQVYARETLLNDRRREADFLRKQIEDSVGVEFEPQLKRVVESVRALQASANATYAPNPAAGRAEEQAQLQQELDLGRKRAELQELELRLLRGQQALDAARTAPPPAPSDPAAPPAATTPPEVATLSAQINDLKAQIGTLNGQIEKLQRDMAAQPPTNLADRIPKAGQLGSSSIRQSPRDRFRDLQAYRSDLRAAEASVQLDDSHDMAAHALYRLQFNTTVVPGAKKDKFAVVQLTVQPSTVSDEDAAKLYRLWLAHVAFRSNGLSGPSKASHEAIDPSYLALAATSDLYSLVRLPPAERPADQKRQDPWEYQVVVPPALAAATHDLLSDRGKVRSYLTSVRSQAAARRETGAACVFDKAGAEKAAAVSYIASSMRAMGNWRMLDEWERPHFEAVMRDLAEVNREAAICGLARDRNDFVPALFNAFVQSSTDRDAWTTAYATAPTDLSQQVSTAAAAIESLQLALSLSARMPLQGLLGDGSLNYMQAARGQAEALERLPLVAGFSDRQPCAPQAREGKVEPTRSCARFGWIVGPHARLDPAARKIRLAQGVENYPVTVDLSVPSWWQEIRMTLQTSWIGNWHEGVLLGADPQPKRTQRPSAAEQPHVREVVMRPRQNRADMDGLTEALAARTVGGALATTLVSEVDPRTIRPCGATVSLLVFGSNIWRGTEAYLDGVPAIEIRTAPDMAGLALKFATSDLPPVETRTRKFLMVWTRNGPAQHEVFLAPRSECLGGGANPDVAGQLQVAAPRLTGDHTKIDVVATSSLPGVPASLELTGNGAQPRNIAVTATEFGDGKTTTLAFPAKLSESPVVKNWPEGTVFKAKVQFQAPPNGKGALLPVSRDMVYYPTAPVLKPDPQSKTLTSLDTPILVRFPKQAAKGFNGFDPKALKATIGDGLQYKLKLVRAAPSGDGYLYQLALEDPGLDDALRKEDRSISLRLDTSDPISCEACVVLKARPPPKAAD